MRSSQGKDELSWLMRENTWVFSIKGNSTAILTLSETDNGPAASGRLSKKLICQHLWGKNGKAQYAMTLEFNVHADELVGLGKDGQRVPEHESPVSSPHETQLSTLSSWHLKSHLYGKKFRTDLQNHEMWSVDTDWASFWLRQWGILTFPSSRGSRTQ